MKKPDRAETKSKVEFEIRDWADNICFKGQRFESFDDAEEFLCLQFEHLTPAEEAEERGEYYICTVKGNSK